MRSLVASLAAVLLVTVCAVSANAQLSRWSAGQERNFVAGCTATRVATLSDCRCELQWLEKRYSYATLASIVVRDRTRAYGIMARGAIACTAR